MSWKVLILCMLLSLMPLAFFGQDWDKFIGGKKNQTTNTSESLKTNQDSIIQKADTLQVSKSLEKMLSAIMQDDEETTEREIGLEINGLIVDQTRTKAGKDFYDHFFRNWEAPETSVDFSISIQEKPFRLRTTQIILKINDREIFQSMLQPRRDYIEMLADYAIARSQQFLANYEAIMQQLGGEDQMGSGIY